MKKILSLLTLVAFVFWGFTVNSQCYTSTYGLWPSATFTPTCNNTFANITTAGYASEYSNVNLVAGNTYTFRSSNTADYITVDNNGAAPLVGVAGVGGINGLTWVCTVTGVYRFYTHTSAACGASTTSRTRSIRCTGSVPPPPTACNNTTSYGSAVVPSDNVTINTVSCAYAGEYSTWTGAVSGQTLRFTSTVATDFITVRSGSPGGTVVAQGTQPLQFVNNFTGTLYVHVNTNSSCGTASACRNISGQCTSCPAPVTNPCTSIATISACGTDVSATMSGTGSWSVTNCGFSTPGQEKIFQFTPATSGTYNVNVTAISGGYIDFFWKAASGGCSATGWNCIDDIVSTGTAISATPMAFTAGTTYYILLDPEGTGSYSATFNIGCPPPPAADPCTSITSLSSCTGSATSFSIASGTGLWDGYGGPFGVPGQERIFSFTPTTTASYPITVVNNGSSSWVDLFWKPASGGCNSSGWTYVNDYYLGTETQAVTFTAGVTYYILLDPEASTGATGTIQIGCPDSDGDGIADNVDACPTVFGTLSNGCPCIGAAVDASYTYSAPITISGTTVDACDNSSLRAGYDRIYEINIPCPGSYTFSLCNGATWDTWMSLSSASGSGLLASNDDFCSLQSQITYNVTTAGTYYIAVEPFSNGTTGTFTLNITGTGSVPSLSGVVTNASCNGSSNGSINLTASSAAATTYSWSNGATTEDLSGIAAGTYTVTATNCWGSSSATYTVTEPAAISISVSSTVPNNTVCMDGDLNLAATVLGGGGTLNYGWEAFDDASGQWITFTSNQGAAPFADTLNLVGMTATSMYRMVASSATDANCTANAEILVEVVDDPVLTTSTTAVTCNGGSNGGASVSLSGGVSPSYDYSWSNGATGTSISGVTAGTYDVTATGLYGCNASASATIAEPVPLTAVITSTAPNTTICTGGTAPLTATVGGTGTVNYQWQYQDNNGNWVNVSGWSGTNVTVPFTNNRNASPSATRAYRIVVTRTNDASCVVIGTQVVTVIADPVFTITSTNISCFGASDGTATAVLTGGLPLNYGYNWSSNDGIGTNNNPAGDGTLSVTGLFPAEWVINTTVAGPNYGCYAQGSVFITQPAVLAATSTSGSIACNGGTTTVTVAATGGTAPYTGTGSFTVGAGTYSYTVVDANGCSTTTSITVTQPTALTASNVTSNYNGFGVSCNGGSNGSINVSAAGGTAPYSGTGLNTGLTAGSYSYTVTDANGCTASTSATITEPTALEASSNAPAILCNGGTATVTVSAAGGVAPYTWNEALYTVPAGTYTYTVVDGNGCIGNTTITVVEPAALSIQMGSSDYNGYAIACNGDANGSSTAIVNGGVTPYSYSWSNGATTAGISNLTAGTYDVTVTDANGCIINGTAILTEPDAVTIETLNSEILCYGDLSTVKVITAGGVTPYAYDDAGIYNVPAGTYTYSITDANGCSASTTITITQPTQLTINAGGDEIVYYGYAPTACATLESVGNGGGTPGYSFSWSANGALVSAGNTYTACPSTSTVYTATVVDANGCIATDDVVVCAVDVTCTSGNSEIHKVQVCKTGKFGKQNTLCVDANAVPALLANGCTLGACNEVQATCFSNSSKAMEIADEASTLPAVLSVYPNPTSSTTTVSLTTLEAGEYTVEMYNVMGQKVMTVFSGTTDFENNTFELDMSTLESGIYMLGVSVGGEIVHNIRVVKN